MSIYPIVLILIPMLQKRANRANKKRVDITRVFSGKIAESISGVHEIHGNAAYGIENRKYDSLVNRLLRIRIAWNVYRYAVKVVNNFINNLSPFLIFLLGGYLAMTGRLELGSLVAFLSAQEKLYDPWRELLDFYTGYQDASVRYYRTMEYFDVEPEYALAPEDRTPYELPGDIEIKGLSFQTDSGIRLLDGISFSLAHGETMALVGFSGSGKSTLAACIGQLYRYTGGHVLIGGKEVSGLTKADTVQTIGIVAQSPFIFDGTIEENLLYSCRATLDEADAEQSDGQLPSLDDMIGVLQQSGIFVDVLRFGLNAILDRERYPDLAPKLVRVRENFQRDFGDLLADYVEFFDPERYLYHSSISENLVMGTAAREEFAELNLPRNAFFIEFLKEVDMYRPLLTLGAELSRQTVDILGNLPPEDVFFEQSPIAPDELAEFKLLVERLKKKKLHQLNENDRMQLLEIALRFTPAKHKMVALPDMLRQLILEARAVFREQITDSDPEAFAFYDISEYIYSQTILNNIFFGKTTTTNPRAQEKINQSIIQLLIEEDFLEKILEIGMQYQVGTKGDKLSGGQQQKLAIARVFLKGPNILIMDEATSALDNKSQTRIQNLIDTRWKGRTTVLSVVHRLDTIKTYDKVAVMKAGKIVEFGSYEELMEKKGFLYELVGK
jgi:ABC-type multidrug transport system fused ATPase/permease subunit